MYKAIHYFEDGRRSAIHVDGSEPFSDGHIDIERNSYVTCKVSTVLQRFRRRCDNGPLWDKLYHEPFTISNTSLVWCFGIFPIF